MTHTITIHHTGSDEKTQFTCNADQAVLDAALAAGLVLPYGCKNGACGNCKAPLNAGLVTHKLDNSTVKQAVAEGAALLCCAMPQGDASFTTRVAKVDAEYPLKKLPSRIASITSVADGPPSAFWKSSIEIRSSAAAARASERGGSGSRRPAAPRGP